MFGTSGVRGPVGDTITADLALDIGRALVSEGYRTVVVGRDVRETGSMLLDALMAGISECGGRGIEVGVQSTPTIARSVDWLGADAGVSITASHNPPADNGIKLWTPTGQAFDGQEQEAIARRVESGSFTLASWETVGRRDDAHGIRSRHASAITRAVTIPDGPSVAVDLGNGAGGVTVDALTRLGCSVRTLNGQEDGSFPGRPSEPTAETVIDLSRFVESTNAALGIAHDGDADRMLAVDEEGTFVPKDVLLAIFAGAAVAPDDSVAAPVDTSMAVEEYIEHRGASLSRTRVGDVYVADRTREPGIVFGGEPSGAWIWPDETLCPDGPLAAAKLVELVVDRGPLSSLVEAIDTYPIRRTAIDASDPDRAMDMIAGTVTEEYEDVSTLDGVRVALEDGWFLLRASGTQPLIRVTAEARTGDRADQYHETAVDLVESTLTADLRE